MPLLILIETRLRHSVPVNSTAAGGSISKLVANYTRLHVEECDARIHWQVMQSSKAPRNIAGRRKGPALVHAHCHASLLALSFRRRKTLQNGAQIEEMRHRDPIPKIWGYFCVRERIVEEKELEKLEADVDHEIREATDKPFVPRPPLKECLL